MKSRTVGAEPSRRNAFGQETLSRELTWHKDAGLAGDVNCTVTKAPVLTPATSTLK